VWEYTCRSSHVSSQPDGHRIPIAMKETAAF
jgi:hypothetical protein